MLGGTSSFLSVWERGGEGKSGNAVKRTKESKSEGRIQRKKEEDLKKD